MIRVAITFAGGRLGLGHSRNLNRAPEDFYLIGLDTNPYMLQRAEVDEKYLVPRADDPDYIPILQDLIKETKPDLLIANHDGEAYIISQMASSLDVAVFLPALSTMEICKDKMVSSERFRHNGVPVPESMLVRHQEDLRKAFKDLGPKLWIRALQGAGGKGSLPAESFEKAKRWIDWHEGWGNFMAA